MTATGGAGANTTTGGVPRGAAAAGGAGGRPAGVARARLEHAFGALAERQAALMQAVARHEVEAALVNQRGGGGAGGSALTSLPIGLGFPGVPLDAPVNPVAHLMVPFPHELVMVALVGQPSEEAETWNCTVDLKVATPSEGLAQDATDTERAEDAFAAFNRGDYPSITGTAKPSLHDEYARLQTDLTPYTRTVFPAWSFWVVYIDFLLDMDVLTIEPIFRRT